MEEDGRVRLTLERVEGRRRERLVDRHVAVRPGVVDRDVEVGRDTEPPEVVLQEPERRVREHVVEAIVGLRVVRDEAQPVAGAVARRLGESAGMLGGDDAVLRGHRARDPGHVVMCEQAAERRHEAAAAPPSSPLVTRTLVRDRRAVRDDDELSPRRRRPGQRRYASARRRFTKRSRDPREPGGGLDLELVHDRPDDRDAEAALRQLLALEGGRAGRIEAGAVVDHLDPQLASRQLVDDLHLAAVPVVGVAHRIRDGLGDRKLELCERLVRQLGQVGETGERQPGERDELRPGRNPQPNGAHPFALVVPRLDSRRLAHAASHRSFPQIRSLKPAEFYTTGRRPRRRCRPFARLGPDVTAEHPFSRENGTEPPGHLAS